jgi:photosystem II stability/assembly factor-like uncharacterized protein
MYTLMKKRNLNIVLTIALMIYSGLLFSQSGWGIVNSGTSLRVADVIFLNENTGYIACNNWPFGNGLIRKSTNGGQLWTTVLTLSDPLMRLYFLDANTGTTVGVLGIIRKTTNGGSSWLSQTSPAGSSALFGVKFTNANTGFIAGDFRTILFTTDGGSTWINRPFGGSDFQWRDAFFFDANTGIVVGYPPTGQAIIKTTDSGLSWNYMTGQINAQYDRVSFVNNSIGFCVGTGSSYAIAKTTDSGNNWIAVNNTGSFIFSGLHAIDSTNIVITGTGGRIFRTSNSGLNWLQQSSGTTRKLYGVYFINSNTGWACGDTGTLLKTTTGGFTGIEPISNEIPNNYKLFQNYPNPFNPNSKINFQIAKLSEARLIVYDVLGKVIQILVNEKLSPGIYEVAFGGDNLPSGVYYYQLISGEYVETKKMVLIR